MSNYADDETLYCYGKTINKVNATLKKGLKLVTTWFNGNYVLLNHGRYNQYVPGLQK